MCIYLALCIVCGWSVTLAQVGSDINPVMMVTIVGVAGENIELPCNISSSLSNDKVQLVIWYKKDSAVPIYTFDARGVTLSRAHQHPSYKVLGSRAYFSINQGLLGKLLIDKIYRSDRGLYICRVDFTVGPTQYSRIKLGVIVPPDPPLIFDSSNQTVSDTVGPYVIGDLLNLTCFVNSGDPLPGLAWFRGIHEISTNTVSTNEGVKNTLVIPHLTRYDCDVILECRAQNNNMTKPASVRIKVKMKLSPLSVTIEDKFSPVMYEVLHQFRCVTFGSRPYVTMTWLIQDVEIIHDVKLINNSTNQTTSILSWTPRKEDDGRILKCVAENKELTGSSLSDESRLTVYYSPTAFVRLGKPKRPENIQAGEDVILECAVTANPSNISVHWIFNGEKVKPVTRDNVKTRDNFIIIRNSTFTNSGVYSCVAENAVGVSRSDNYDVNVKFAPLCLNHSHNTIAAAMKERVQVVCSVASEPRNVTFKWAFTNSVEVVDLPDQYFYSEGLSSVLLFKVRSESDYGTILCWAVNQIGTQKEPCVFTIKEIGPPMPVDSCALGNQNSTSVTVFCESGFDGGISQWFSLEVVDKVTSLPIEAQRSEVPRFSVSNLSPGKVIVMRIYSWNDKGRSGPVILETEVLEEAMKRKVQTLGTDDSLSFTLFTPVFITLISLVGALFLLTIFVIIILQCHRFFRKRRRRHQIEGPHVTRTTTTGELLHENKSFNLSPVDSMENFDDIKFLSTPCALNTQENGCSRTFLSSKSELAKLDSLSLQEYLANYEIYSMNAEELLKVYNALHESQV